MKEFFSLLRLAVYVLALPLTVTAVASAHQWLSLSAKAEPVSGSVLTSHVVRLSDNGMVRGLVNTFNEEGERVAVGNSVASLVKNGQLAARVNSGFDGAFSFSNVEPGKYTFISAGKDSIATFGVEVVAAGSASGSNMLGVFAAPRNGALEPFVAKANAFVRETEDSATEVGGSSDRVRLNVDGDFAGKVTAFNGNMGKNMVRLFSRDQVVAESTIAQDGSFKLSGVQPGLYSFVADGTGGFATVAVEVIGNEAFAPTETVYTTVSRKVQESDSFFVTMVQDPVEYEIVEEVILVEEVIDEPIAAVPNLPAQDFGNGGFGGGGGGFGGGGGGLGGNFGGVGNLIGLGIGAWALTEIIDSVDNNNNRIPTPVPVPNPPAPISGYTWVYL